LLRTLHLTLLAPIARPVKLTSNTGGQQIEVSSSQQYTATVCVPPKAPADLTLRATGANPIEGDPSTSVTVAQPRQGGVLVNQVTLDPPSATATCSPSPGTR
jgi:hypothetical protein